MQTQLLIEIWWTQDIEAAYRRWAEQHTEHGPELNQSALKAFADECGWVPRWAA